MLSNHENKYTRRCIAIVLLIILVNIAATLYRHYLFKIEPFRGRLFDSVEWKEAAEQKRSIRYISCIRAEMVWNLKQFFLIKGQHSKNEVVLLLGTGYETHPTEKRCILYPLGMCSSLREHYDMLTICFDDQELIERVSVIQQSKAERTTPHKLKNVRKNSLYTSTYDGSSF